MKPADLKSWRARQNLSQERAAEVLGCAKASIARWEKGQRIPRYIALACAAIAHGIPPIGG